MDGCIDAFLNLRAMLRIFGRFDKALFSEEMPELLLYDGGVDDPQENYALFTPPGYGQDETHADMEQIAGRSADFSERTGRPLHWPVFPGAPDRLGRILRGLGLKREDDHIAMRASLEDPIPAPAGAPKISGPLRDENAVRRWAEYAWRGFDSGEMPPEPFVTFALNMARRPEISLVCAPGAAGMLCAAEGSAGIYYVATVPEYRGRGLGGAVVEALKAAARGMGFGTVTLLATPRGHPLYLRHGFRDTGAVQIYS